MKRPFLLSLLACSFLSAGCAHFPVESSESDLCFKDLATVWDEAMPLGNATVGELVWQRGEQLRLSLDRIDLWDLRPSESHQGDHYSFDWIKAHIRSGAYDEVLEKFRNTDPAPSKIPGAALEVNTAGWGPVKDSRLFLKNALCEVNWQSGVRLRTFVQADAPVGWVVFDNLPDSSEIQIVPPVYSGKGKPAKRSLQLLGYPQGDVRREGNRITYHQCGYGDFSYDVTLRWKRSGKRLVGVWSITSSFSGQNASEEVDKAFRLGPEKAYKHHLDYWKGFWAESVVSVPDSLIQREYDREIYKFGSAARENSYPISLQSVWTADDGKLPPWRGDFNHDLNTQLSYWPAYSGNRLSEELGYLNTLWAQRDTYKDFTRTFFGKEGLNTPGVCTLLGKALGSNWVMYGFSQTTSAWLSQHFYLHWKYSADPDFLRNRAYPFIQDVAVFLEQQSIVREDGVRTLEYSSSPEIHDNHLEAWFTEITNFDLSLMRFVFSAASEMADALGRSEEAARWKRCAEQMPDFALDEEGGLAIAPGHPYNVSHRHFSHALAIYPLGLLDKSQGPESGKIIDATLARLHANGPDWWTGYSYAWLANLEARAGHGEEAAEALRSFASCFVLRNSFHVNGDQTKSGKSRYVYRPFTLEGNFAFASGVQEMLLQSQSGVIEVFPAIPKNWKDVRFERLRAIGAFLVSADMEGGEVVSLTVSSEKGGSIRIRDPRDGSVLSFETNPGETVTII